MKILVTGVAGAIGSHVAEALVAAGHSVVGVDAYTPYYSRTIKEITTADIKASGVEVRELDLCTDDLDRLLEEIEVIYHFAAQPGISATTPFADYVNNNIYATQRLLEAARKSSTLKLFVHISTSSVYGKNANDDETMELKPTSYYGVTKMAAEQLAMAFYRDKQLPVTVLRLFSVYGERERPEKLYHKIIRDALNGTVFTLYEGAEHHVRSFTYVEDIVRGCLLVLDHTDTAVGEIFNLGNDRTITTGDGIKIIEGLLGHPIEIERVPKRPGDQQETAAKIDKARRILGYSPQTQPEEGLKKELEWYRSKLLGVPLE